MLTAKPLLERVLARFCLSVRLALAATGIAAAIASLGLSACGREGALELPPGPASAPAPTSQLQSSDGFVVPGSAQDTALKNGFDAQGNPVATTGQKKQFILDPILQ
jgi:predicted small lipoprotein YifL